VGIGVAVGETDSPGEAVTADEPDSSGSTFVKYGELFAATYQSGAASNFFNILLRGSTLQNSRSLPGFSHVKTILAAIRRENWSGVLSGIVVGQLAQEFSILAIQIEMGVTRSFCLQITDRDHDFRIAHAASGADR